MSSKAVFTGLVFDEWDQPVETTTVGQEAFYVVNDAGFRRHISAEEVDRQILNLLKEQIKGNEGLLADQAAKMLGQDDIFSRAMIGSQFKNIDQQIEHLLQMGLPEEGRTYLGMMGIKIVINLHGEVLSFEQPGRIASDEDE